MKDIEKLKIEQKQLKDKLLKLIDFINSEEYYTLDSNEKSLLMTQRAGMETYLSALTKRIYGDTNEFGNTSLLPLFLMSMVGNTPFTPTKSFDTVAKEIEEKKNEKDEK